MTAPSPRHACTLAVLTLMLAACGSQDDPPAATAAPAYAAVARGRVDVEGGLLNLGMPREGTLAEVDVREGAHVQRGQTLAALDDQAAQLAVTSAQAELAQARAQLALLDARQAAARQHAARLEAAARAGAGDGQSADDAHTAMLELAAQQEATRAGVALAEQKLAGARFELAQRTLRAPLEADVVRVAAQPGASVSPQAGALFVLLPRTPRIVRADLSEAYAGSVKAGMPAQVNLDGALDASGWRAHVLRVGEVVGASALEDDPQQRANTRTVECVLAFDTPDSPRVGQRVMVRFGTKAR